jgi:hypothetical protein
LFIDSPTGVDNIIVKFFRNTNTSSNKSVIFSRGDGTDTAHAQIGVDGVNSFFQIGGGNFGIGTSTPWAKFSLAAVAANTSPLFSISTSTANSTSTAFHIDSNGKVGIGTSSPYTQLSVQGGIAGQFYNADATTSTSTFAGGLNIANGALQYDYSAGLTTIENLALGALSFDTDAGIVTWVDMPVTSSATVGTVESYTARIDGNALLTVYAVEFRIQE